MSGKPAKIQIIQGTSKRRNYLYYYEIAGRIRDGSVLRVPCNMPGHVEYLVDTTALMNNRDLIIVLHKAEDGSSYYLPWLIDIEADGGLYLVSVTGWKWEISKALEDGDVQLIGRVIQEPKDIPGEDITTAWRF